jgi:DNA-binding LytR/AlgR family response regulator
MKTKVLIVEDEFTIALDIESRLVNLGYEVVGIAINYDEALPYLLESEIDTALLDINLEDKKSGIDLGKLILKKFNIPVVFLTAYTDDETFIKANEANPMGYLNKPFKDSDLDHALKLAFKQFQHFELSKQVNHLQENKTKEFIFIKNKGQLIKISINEILWIEALDNYTVIHLYNKRYIANSFLKDMLKTLGNSFIRIHRSHAVAIDKITSIDDNTLFINDIHLSISKSCKSNLLEKLNTV